MYRHSHFFVVILLALLVSHASAETQNYAKNKKIRIAAANKEFRVGEKLVYTVRWNGIPIGEGILEIKETVQIGNKEAYHIVATAKTNEFLAKIYNVEDVVETYIDKKDLCSLRFQKKQREGKYRAEELTDFDQDNHKGHYRSLLNKSKKDFDIPAKVQDLASAFYYFRTLDVKPDSKVVMDVNADEKNWKVTMHIAGASELEMLNQGVKEVFCVEPKAPFKGVLAKRSRVWVYFTADQERIPVFIKIRIPFGFVVGVLERME